ncbi:MAG: TolC family protein [Bacteroidota bacterium]
MKKSIIHTGWVVGVLLLSTQLLHGQGADTLNLGDAIALALNNNYGIQVARYDVEISENNATAGNAGLLPRLDFSAGANFTENNQEVIFASPEFPPVDTIASNESQNAGLTLSYRVFDGLGNVNNFKVFKSQAALSRAQLRSVVEANLTQVINAYYQIARLEGNYRILTQTMSISRERLSRVMDQQEFGAANKLAVLNAEVDFNTDSVNMATAFVNLDNARRELSVLVGIDPIRRYGVEAEVSFQTDYALDAVLADAEQNNANMEVASKNLYLAELNYKVSQSSFFPTLDLNASYNYSNLENGPGNLLAQQTALGWTVGASLNFTIFDGFRKRTQSQNAKIQVESTRSRMEETQATLRKDVLNAYYSFVNSLRILVLEQKSLEAAELNFERTREVFKLGQGTATQFREAQLNLQRVKNRLNDLQYDVKLAETELQRLSGRLMSE